MQLASTVGKRMSLHFDFILLRSGTFNTVAFDKLEALYFKDFLNFFERHLIQSIFRLLLLFCFVEFLTIILDPPIHGDL